jgi:hypothetical protein
MQLNTPCVRLIGFSLLVGAVVAVSGCSPTSSEVEAGKEIVLKGGKLTDELARAQELRMTAAAASAAKADASARTMSHDTGLPLDETQEKVCALVDAYQSKGTFEDFVDWGIDRLRVSPSSRIYWERALEDLGQAVEMAERGDAIGAFVSATCAP